MYKQVDAAIPYATADQGEPVPYSADSKYNILADLFSLCEEYPLSGLSKTDQGTPLSGCTLGQLAKIFERSSREDMVLHQFFGDEKYKIMDDMKNIYEHNLMQHCMKDFFASLGYEKIYEGGFDDESKESSSTNVKCSPNKTFSSYTDATLVYVNHDSKSKFMINLNSRRYNQRVYYRFFFDEKSKNVYDEWMKYSKKNNFYKGQKIDADCNFLQLDENISWDDVVISDKIREAIRRSVENMFKYHDILKKNNIKIKQGTIMEGSPGCVIKGTGLFI